ncbi:MAG: hypothetical protein GPJ06_11605, partial [Microcystis aeruginosa G13-11]|nr:hypothetical protein [Microcystis aeruginosa G13-11]
MAMIPSMVVGVNPNNPIPGLNERDTIVSGTGSDRIILGDTHWLAYDDRNTTTNGTGDYATIADFDVNFDVIQLQGQKNNYRLAISGLDTWLYLDKPGTEPDELIAIIQGKTNLNLDSQNFVYVEPVNTPPTTSDNSLVTDEDTNLVFTANNFNFSDVDSDDSLQAIRLETLPTEGILYVDSNNNGIVNTGETISQGSLVTVAAINAGQLKFKPDANENGTPYTNFTFSVSDGEDLSITPAKITLNVTPINDAPTNIQLTNSNVNENSPINTIIGQISISDPDLNDTHTLTLIDDAGGRFKLVGSQLQVANASLLDYETKTNHSITIKASDTGNLSFEKALTITVNNVNESPSAIQLTNTSINENSPNSTVIGILNTTDPDANNTFTYSLVDNAGGRFAINGNQLIVADGTKLDYEINQKHTITIRTQDQGGLTYDQTFDINLIDVADSSVIAFSQPTYTVKEDGTPITEITLTRSISTQGQVSVTVTPSNGTATSPLDYNNAPITVTFADGETSKKIAIPIVKDTAYEGNETLNLTLSNPTNGATIGTQKTATLTIVDTPITYYLTTPTTWTDAQAQAQAMGGNLVTINDAAENQFLVNAFGSNESFWIGFTDAVQEGDWKWINGEPVTYVNWSLGEPNNNGNEDYGIINDPYDPGPSEKWYDLPNNPPSHFPPQLKGIIEVLNGTSTISIADTTINESENQATVTVKLTGISQQTFTVDYNTNDGTAKAGEDYTTVSGKLTFNAGESVKTITVLINNDTAYEGNETFTLNLSNPTGGAVLGTSTATITIIDDDVPQPGTLAFSNAQFSVNEDGTPVNQIKIIRTGGSQGEVSATINLTNGTATPEDYDIASIPVTFANGETEKFVTIPIANDTLVENTETINLTLINPTNGATLGTQKAAVLSILDDDVQLNFNAANYTVREDGTAVTDIIITRTGRTTGTVGATLNFANGTATGCPCPPASVTYDFYNGAFAFTLDENEMSKVIQVEDAKLAGSNAIRIRNDSKVEGDEYFTINLNNPTGGATIGNQNSATVTILDDDVQLAFSSPTFTIREDGTAIAAVTVNRLGRLTGVVGATLNLDGGNATYPDDYTQTSLNISFAEGENSKIINIPVRNDIISEPDETVNLTLVNPTGSATIGSQNTATLTIVDNGLTPSLSLAIDKDTVAENAGNNAATATITRSIVTDEDLIVTLASNDTSEITVPNQVIIPANQASATFTLNAVNDNIPDGIQNVTITATATGFSQGTDTINVADINVPDLKIVNLSASTPLLTGKQGSFTYRVVNQGLSEAKGTWTDKIYLSTDTTLETNKDIFLDNYQFSGTIPTGLFYERNLPFFIPKTPGQYYLIAQTDTANTVKEGIGLGENNNTTITSINITPAYRATVSTDTEIGVTGNKVILQGKAFSNSDNSAVPYEFVTIAIKYNGTVRELTAFTDGNGNFVKEFQPLPGEGGQYQINAYFPNYSSEDSTAEDSFKLLGMRFNTGGAYYQINADSPFNATATLQNLTDIPITGITYSIDGAPQDWNIQVSAANTLAGNSNLPITYTITAPNNSPITQDTFNINLTSAEGVSTTLPVTINLRRIVPHLVANTNLLSNGMLRGQQTPIEFTVTNNGGIATGEVQVILPNAPWLKLASPVKLSSLNPGESSKVTLLLAPDANLPLTVYNGNLVLDVVGNDGDLSLPFSFRAVSDAVGSLQITVVDELTFFTESAPKLKDATIILRDYITGNEVRRITTDATGMVSWDNLSEGYYQLEVKAKSHDSYTQTIQIKAGETEDIESFLSRQTVKYVWRVVPTEIEDKYTITIESVFETHVPALDGSSDSIANPIPTVTIDPPLIDLINLQVVGQMMQVDMTVTNHGLIAANDVRLNFGEHPFYKIEPLIENIGTLGAKSSMTVPVRITRIADTSNGVVSCGIPASLTYDYSCGSNLVLKSTPIAINNVEGNCALLSSIPISFGGVGFNPVNGGFNPGNGEVSSISPIVSSVPIEIQSNSCNQGSVCAQVKLQINQDAIMTRSGFLGTLEIDNGNDTNNLESLTVTINIKDGLGNTVNNLFGITNPILSNITAVDGTGTLLANSSGSAEWTFIPTGIAAPNEPTIYSIGGSLSYKENGNNITVPLLSTPVTVFPQAELYLDYFHQRDVFADDPFTVEIETSVPFSLGILVKNQGKGTAKNLHISSAQPKIIDNEKGLLIDFNIIGTQIGTESITPSLTVNFGNIEAGKTAVADWLFKSDLQGKFTDYKATFEHINDLGKPELSLIKEVKIHELTHQVNVDSDNLPDFLVNDIPDPNFYPDTLYFSNGATAPVNVVTNATATINNQQAQIIVNVNSGWTYLHLTEPSNGSLEIAQVLRSDGTSIKLDNVWTTDRTFPATGRPIYENILHLLDYNANAGNSNYTIIYTSGGPTVTDIIDVTPDPRSTAVNAITIDFSEPIQASTFDYTDLSLTLNNGTNLITNIVSIIPLSTTRYQVTGLENLTNIDGDYQLTVNANGIKDLDGKLGTGLLSETWIKTATGNADNTPPTVTDIRDLQIDPRNIPVSSLDVTLSEAIDLSSFTWEDITLTRNSGSNLINNTVTITPVNDTTYRINGLNNLTQTEGTYTLTVNGNEIKDLSGNLGIGSASEIWVMDTTPPDAPSNLKVGNKTITPNSQNLVNTTTLNLTGDLGETGLSVFLIDRTLNQSLGQASVNNTQFSSTIQLPSSGTRNLDIQIIDPAGNITTTNFNLFADIITPTLLEFLNIPQTPIATPINSIDLRFSEAINLSTFDYTDITLQRNNGENLINDAVTVEYLSGTTYRIKGLTELTTTTGNYQLTVNSNTLQDPAGNSGDAAKTATFAIITAINNPPIAQDDALTTNEDTLLTGNLLINNGSGADSDPDKDSLTVTAVNSNTANVGTQIILSSGALLTLNTNGTLTYNPNGQFEALKNGEITTDSFTYTLSDGNGGTDTATVTATITGVNDAPVANPDSYILDEDNTLTINTPGVKGNDTDAENDSLTVNLVSPVAKG